MILNILKCVISLLMIYFSYYMLTGKEREKDYNIGYKKLLERKKEIQYILSNHASVVGDKVEDELRKELVEIEKKLEVDNILNKVIYAIAGIYAFYTLFTVATSTF